MTKSQLNSLSHEELITLSKQKNKKGCATHDALEAQKILWQQGNCCAGLKSGSVMDMDGKSFRGMDRQEKNMKYDYNTALCAQ